MNIELVKTKLEELLCIPKEKACYPACLRI